MTPPMNSPTLTAGSQGLGGADAQPALVASPSSPQAVSTKGFDQAQDDEDPWPDYEDDCDCWNCGGEGYVYGCSWDWQCDTYDAGEGTCLCTRPCHICHPPKHDAELRKVLAEALASADTHPKGGDSEAAPALLSGAVPQADAQPHPESPIHG